MRAIRLILPAGLAALVVAALLAGFSAAPEPATPALISTPGPVA